MIEQVVKEIKEIADKQIDKKVSTINRRDFLIASAIALLSGKTVYDSITKSNETDIEQMIYNEYPKYLHMSYSTAKYVDMMRTHEKRGMGIVVDDKYVTCAHIVDCSRRYMNTPYGTMQVVEKMKDEKTMLYGMELKILYQDNDDDVAVLQIPKEVEIKHRFNIDDICFDEPKFGEEVYIVGNPALMGVNVRKDYVSDTDGLTVKNIPSNPNRFGFGKALLGGDSGTFTVNKQGKVIGINSSCLGGLVGYAVKMKAYEKWLR